MFGVRYPMMPRLYALTLNQPMSSAMMNRMFGLFVPEAGAVCFVCVAIPCLRTTGSLMVVDGFASMSAERPDVEGKTHDSENADRQEQKRDDQRVRSRELALAVDQAFRRHARSQRTKP